jgi:hypothetical protein
VISPPSPSAAKNTRSASGVVLNDKLPTQTEFCRRVVVVLLVPIDDLDRRLEALSAVVVTADPREANCCFSFFFCRLRSAWDITLVVRTKSTSDSELELVSSVSLFLFRETFGEDLPELDDDDDDEDEEEDICLCLSVFKKKKK